MKQYALIGKKLDHSYSEKYFKEKFEKHSIDAKYTNLELNDLKGIRKIIASKKITGFNVTIPYKEEIIRYLDEIDDQAKSTMAVNCVRIKDEKWTGYNTDITGFRKSIKHWIPGELPRALIFGTGGAAKAVQCVLEKEKVIYQSVSRKNALKTISYTDLDEKRLGEYYLLINTTPVGMYPHINDMLPVPLEHIGQNHFVYDLIYNPPETLFLEKCRMQGANTKNGLEMLIIQAEKSYEIWSED